MTAGRCRRQSTASVHRGSQGHQRIGKCNGTDPIYGSATTIRQTVEQELREMRHQLVAAITRIDALLAELAEEETRRTDFDPSRLAAD